MIKIKDHVHYFCVYKEFFFLSFVFQLWILYLIMVTEMRNAILLARSLNLLQDCNPLI
jgi:hypothetical protein